MTELDYDVAIIGGGPAGTTVGCLLRKYAPELRVLILEREKFPREHVGESQLPPIGAVLDEMGCWDKVEAANFPIKIGATYRWGKKADLWDFDFLADVAFREEPRPGKFEGQRVQTAFQVERAVYDDILLRHAEELRCEVREETAVVKVHADGDRVTGLELKDGSQVTAKHYVDASGHGGVLRRAMGIEVTVPTRLKNIAIYDYWENAEWATEIGIGGTRVQVMSQSNGWLWFIPLGPTRTSIGFVCPAEYYKSLDENPEELYHRVVRADELGKSYAALVYGKTAVMMETLRRIYGEEPVLAAVGAYARDNRFGHPTPAELVTAVRDHVGDAAAHNLRLALMEGAWIDHRVEDLDLRGEVYAVRQGELAFDVDVELHHVDGKVERRRWPAGERVFRAAGEGIDAVLIDPELDVLVEHDLANNVTRRSPGWVAPRAWSQMSFLAQMLTAVWVP